MNEDEANWRCDCEPCVMRRMIDRLSERITKQTETIYQAEQKILELKNLITEDPEHNAHELEVLCDQAIKLLERKVWAETITRLHVAHDGAKKEIL